MPTGRRGTERESISDNGLDDLIAAAGPPEAPPDLGNFRPSHLLDEPVEPPAPAPASAPESGQPPEYDEPEPEAAEDEPPWQKAVNDLKRENEFLKLAMQRPVQVAEAPRPTTPQDAVQLVDQYLNGFQVRPEDVEVMLRDPQRGAEYLMNGVRAAVAAGAALALNQGRTEYVQDQTQQKGAQDLRVMMYTQHPDLEAYADQVMIEAQRLFAGSPHLRGDAQALVDETARRTRQKLTEWGVGVEAKPPKTARTKVTRLKPAFAEGGGSGGRQGAKSMSSLDREILQLVNAR
jgi:hypothetical protein